MKNDLAETIVNEADIVKVVSHFVDLQKKGRNFMGLCPFHQDSNPSMTVSPDKKIFKCFSCGAGGNVITFVKDFKNISFQESLIEIAKMLSIDLSKYNQIRLPKLDPKKQKIYEINKDALTYFKLYLKSNNGKSGLNYLTKRGIAMEDIDEFDIGFAPYKNELTNFLIKKGHSTLEIINAGLGYEKDGEINDSFKNRIVFTIRDEESNIVGFSARTIDTDGKYAKYINTKETYVFKKNEILYNIEKARFETRASKDIIVCEGFTDVISLWKSGIKNAVAIMGTALTLNHTTIINKYANHVSLLLDSDQAGLNAALKSIATINQTTLEKSVIPMPRGYDIDEVYFKAKEEGVKKILSKKIDWIDFETKFIFNKNDKNTRMAAKEMNERLLLIRNDIDKQDYINKAKLITGIDLSSHTSKVNQQVSTTNTQPEPKQYFEPPIEHIMPPTFENQVPTNKVIVKSDVNEVRCEMSAREIYFIGMVLQNPKVTVAYYDKNSLDPENYEIDEFMDYMRNYLKKGWTTRQLYDIIKSKTIRLAIKIALNDVKNNNRKFNIEVFKEIADRICKK